MLELLEGIHEEVKELRVVSDLRWGADFRGMSLSEYCEDIEKEDDERLRGFRSLLRGGGGEGTPQPGQETGGGEG